VDDINPINYKIHLEPDLQTFKFSGAADISIDAESPTREIALNALELEILSCQVVAEGESKSCRFVLDPKKEVVKVSLPDDMSGNIILRIEYKGEINNKMAGFYRSTYLSDGQEKFAAVTQFEESDARRAFPCFDHPEKKATFDIEMVVSEDLVAISNGPVLEEKSLEERRKFIRFQQTPKMSTYLIFVGVGEFEFIEDEGEVLVRVATMPGMKKYGGFGLEFGRKSLEFSEEYYGIKFPLPKLDLIAIADFAFGAMENWGAITFRENLLLHFPGITSSGGEERICEVIAHEMAHQWFGNLVTPSDWKYLWLNESFATYFGYGIVDHYHPEWGVWEQFLHGQLDSALERDSLCETIPIEIPGGEHVVINASTAPIIYNKGGSVLRQIEGYIGQENFKKGLRAYLKKHEYACASSHHLWEALEEVSEKPISRMMEGWIGQPGFPIIEAEMEENHLILTQTRFTYLPHNSEEEWMIPITIRVFTRDGNSKILTTLLESKRTVIDLGPEAVGYKINEGQTGFFRVLYKEKENFKELGRQVSDKTLGPVDRWGLQNDLYALVRRGDVSLEAYLDFLSNYSDEDAFLPLISMASNLYHGYLVMEGPIKDNIAAKGKTLFERVIKQIGHDPAPDEGHTVSILREPLIWHTALYGSNDVKDFARQKFTSLMNGEKIHQDIMASIMRVGAWHGDSEVFDWLDKQFKTSESEAERMNILSALGSFSDKGLIEKALDYTLSEVPDRNKFVPIGHMAVNPNAIPYMWEWFVKHLDELEQFHPMHYERVIGSIVPLGGIGKEEEVVDFFASYMDKKEKAKDVIKLSLERLAINSGMRSS
jgi:tricorn protease interacting factor F2/3